MRSLPAVPALLSSAAILFAQAAQAEAPRVVADVAPIQSIAARVMQGVGVPEVLLPPGASPHDYSMRPSDAEKLQDADVVVWVGPALTHWLEKPIETLATKAAVVTIEDAPGVTTLPIRAGGPFEPHEHGHEDGDHHDGDHGDAEHDADADHAAGADSGHDHAGHDDHDEHDMIDGHLWLDPDNAAAAARAIAAALAARDPGDAAIYSENAESFVAEMKALTTRLEAELSPLRGKRFIVFHDAYQYLKARFDLPAAGSISLHEGAEPGTARVSAIRDRVRNEDIVCAFTEPEFSPRLLATIIEGTNVRTGELDALGAHIAPGPNLYPTMMEGLAAGLTACLDK